MVDLTADRIIRGDGSRWAACPPGWVERTLEMQILQGITVSPGIAIGEALVLDNEGFRIPDRFVLRDAVESELQRLDQAIDAVAEEIRHNREMAFYYSDLSEMLLSWGNGTRAYWELHRCCRYLRDQA